MLIKELKASGFPPMKSLNRRQFFVLLFTEAILVLMWLGSAFHEVAFLAPIGDTEIGFACWDGLVGVGYGETSGEALRIETGFGEQWRWWVLWEKETGHFVVGIPIWMFALIPIPYIVWSYLPRTSGKFSME